ncbi:MAG: 2-nitropropane dioxygenase, partial [Actinomycetota bacterium]|nr:2-nitropropane dioxygenase [Actinomycetota bacterium]
WSLASNFRNSSAFEHAATLRHIEFGWADVHRSFPGLGGDPDVAFHRLWADRGERQIGGFACAVPSLPAQTLVVLLHAARSPGARAGLDIATVWDAAPPQRRAEVHSLVEQIGAEVGFAAAVGDLDVYRGHPDYPLWRVASHGGTRMEEWWARIRAAPTRRAALLLVLRAPLVNVEHLEMSLWRRPTRREVAVEFFARPARGIAEELRAVAILRQTRRRS